MSQFEMNYAQLIKHALHTKARKTRNAATQSFFGAHLTVDELKLDAFPVLLHRKMFYKGVLGELAAFLQGPTNVKDFSDYGCNYWKAWGDENGDLCLDYGNLWRDFEGVDQLQTVVGSLKADPYGRRHIISGWHPGHLPDLSLPCCHMLYQWYVTDSGQLDMMWYQRSVDLMVGLPSDIILAAMFNILMAQTVGLKPGRLNFFLGDCHVYESHFDQAVQYTDRVSRPTCHRLPSYTLDAGATVFNFKPEMLQLSDFTSDEAIKLKLEV